MKGPGAFIVQVTHGTDTHVRILFKIPFAVQNQLALVLGRTLGIPDVAPRNQHVLIFVQPYVNHLYRHIHYCFKVVFQVVNW